MSIRRVSSRQRLVSWDSFEATTCGGGPRGDGNDIEAYESCIQFSASFTSLASIVGMQEGSVLVEDQNSSLKRKRRVTLNSTRLLVDQTREPHLIPIYEEDDFCTSPREVQLNTLQFLDVNDLRNMAQVNRSQRRLLATKESFVTLWKPACIRQWPWLGTLPTLDFFDAFRSGSFSMLLSLSAPKVASKIDSTLFGHSRWSRSLRSRLPRRTPAELEFFNGGAVQFTGAVGVGDRCIRADAPLPRPQVLHPVPASIFSRLRAQPMLCRGQPQQHAVYKPFCAPFIGSDSKVQLTPRLVSYFEVSILPAPAEFLGTRPRGLGRHRYGTTAPECVAVGLATESFSLHTRMPGWDSQSYGYHGDDGGIFHAAGSMIKEYGSHFGVGDTIGCGVDYPKQAIFFTLNGVFLGYAFVLKDPVQDLFPVIGMDTNCPVECNFGTAAPFQFDLAGMIAKHENIVLQAMRARCDA